MSRADSSTGITYGEYIVKRLVSTLENVELWIMKLGVFVTAQNSIFRSQIASSWGGNFSDVHKVS
jgi:hypothetical protein